MAGAWRLFEFDVTAAAKPGETNALAVEVFPPQPHDLAITFVDWNPQPPDKNMGLWRDVYITATGPVAMRFPARRHAAESARRRHGRAHREGRVEERQPAQAGGGVLKGKIEGIEFSQPVRLAAGETRVVRFTPDKFPQLKIANPRLWWPAQVGPAEPLSARPASSRSDGAVSDSQPHRLRHPRGHLRNRRRRPPPVPHQRQEHPHPRRRLHLRHAAALLAGAAGSRAATTSAT